MKTFFKIFFSTLFSLVIFSWILSFFGVFTWHQVADFFISFGKGLVSAWNMKAVRYCLLSGVIAVIAFFIWRAGGFKAVAGLFFICIFTAALIIFLTFVPKIIEEAVDYSVQIVNKDK